MYSSVDELKLAIGFQITTMQGKMEDDDFDEALGVILENNSQFIDGMINTRVDQSVLGGNAVLKSVELSLSKYDVFGQFNRNEMPEAIREDKREAMKILEKIQKGTIVLVVDTTAETPRIEPSFDEATRVFGTEL